MCRDLFFSQREGSVCTGNPGGECPRTGKEGCARGTQEGFPAPLGSTGSRTVGPGPLHTKRGPGSRRDLFWCEQDCKPGSVFDSHLSRRTVAGTLQPPRERPGQPRGSDPLLPYRCCSDRVYSIGQSPADGCALTAPFHPYPCGCAARVRVACRSLRERPLRRADLNREEGPFVPLHTTPLRPEGGESRNQPTSQTFVFPLPAQRNRTGGISLLHFS